MTERDDLLASVANEIRTYRKGSFPEPTREHVDRWLHQFSPDQQLPFLREFDHVIKQTFFTRRNVKKGSDQIFPNTEVTVKNEALIDLFIKLRNRFFHFSSGNSENISLSDLTDPDEFFLVINPIMLNWLTLIYFEIVRKNVDRYN